MTRQCTQEFTAKKEPLLITVLIRQELIELCDVPDHVSQTLPHFGILTHDHPDSSASILEKLFLGIEIATMSIRELMPLLNNALCQAIIMPDVIPIEEKEGMHVMPLFDPILDPGYVTHQMLKYTHFPLHLIS